MSIDFNAIKNRFLSLDHKNFYLSFKGRVSRSDYGLFGFGLMLVLLVISLILGAAVNIVVSVVLLWPGLALAIKRLHDMNKSGWFGLLFILPLVNLICLFLLLSAKGTDGPNRFGPKP
jgi:uncharacterized membrane protein YhaH (DUF805 family)